MDKRTLPEIRKAMHVLAELLPKAYGDALKALAEETKRRPPTRPRAKAKMKPTYEVDKQAVIKCATDNPNLHISEIATIFGTNPGRISEILQEGA